MFCFLKPQKPLVLTFVLACVCALTSAWAQEPRYTIKAAIDPQAHRILASQTVLFTNNSSKETSVAYFHIYPNRAYTPQEKAFMLRYASYFKMDPFPRGFPFVRFTVSNVQAGGIKADYAIEGKDKTLLKIILPKPLSPGQSVALGMDFAVDIPHAWGRFGWHEDVLALARWYPILAVLTQEGWDQHPFYPFHRPFFSEAAYYTVDLTVPSDEVVIHSGDIAVETTRAQGKTIHIETSNPIREFALAMSPRYSLVEEEKDGIQFKAFYLGARKARAREALKNAQDLFAYYTKLFGPYPYKAFSIAPVHLGYGGEQMSNMIFIDTRVFDLPRILRRHFDFLIAHESGHQWFYNLIGVNNFTQMWLEEGMNSYFLLNYIEDKYGKDAEIIDFSPLPKWVELFVPRVTFRHTQDVRYKMATRMGLEQPIISRLSSFNEPSSIFALTYGKGSKVVGMLKETVGAANFDKIFARIFNEYRFKNLDVKVFQNICEEESSQDLSLFFDEWLRTTKNFDARISAVKGGTVYVERRGGIVMPVDVRVEYRDGAWEDLVWDGKKENDALTLRSAKVRKITLDPHQKLLDIDRANNTWPRQVHVMPVPLYHGLYDIPALLPDDRYNLVIGPEISNGLGVKASFQKPYDYALDAATDYDFNERIQRTREELEIKNVFHSQTTFGVEAMQTADYDTGEDDLNSQKAYLRRELWPAAYQLTEANDHIVLYALRNRTPAGPSFFSERIRGTSYLKHNESIVGAVLHIDRSQPRPDPREGYAVDTLIENSGHWAGATQAFTRASIDGQGYHPVTSGSKMAYHIKYGWGSSDDKNLYELGGMDGLRGFDRKTVRGSNALLGSAEYRFPLADGLSLSVADHILTLDKISAAAFFDAGQAWYGHFDDGKFRKDAGVGLRLHLTIGSFLENVIVRLDVAKAIDEPKEGTHTWFAINHAF